MAPPPPPSRKEREILERQRKLAAQMMMHKNRTDDGNNNNNEITVTKVKPAPPSSSSTTASSSSSRTAVVRPTKRFGHVASNNNPKPPPAPPPLPKALMGSKKKQSNTLKNNLTAASSASLKRKQPSETAVGGAPKPAPPPPAGATQKRPIKRRSVAATIAQARLKAANNNNDHSNSTTNNNSNDSSSSDDDDDDDKQKPSPKVQRKTLNSSSSLASKNSALAKKLMMANKKHSRSAEDGVMMSGSNTLEGAGLMMKVVEPDDFWKHLREWDFVSQFAQAQKQQHQQRPQGRNTKNNDTTTNTEDEIYHPHKAIPNTFLSARHYVAAWAPLCLAECRAQLLQEVALKHHLNGIHVKCKVVNAPTGGYHHRKNNNNNNKLAFDPLDGADTGGYVRLEPRDRGGNNNMRMKFYPSDLVLLLVPTYSNALQDLKHKRSVPPPNGLNPNDPHAYKSVALIGHVEHFRHNIEGLVVKVSRRKWASITNNNNNNAGSQDGTIMSVVPLGANVTALREFTALCHVDRLPVQRYLLGHHLNESGKSGMEDRHGRKKNSSAKVVKSQSVDVLLAKMGGVVALGKGFIDYCRKKFNASQLTAIAASAEEYGHGGLTLIKGPPGTGKTTTLVAVLNSLHIRQFNKYYESVRTIATNPTGARQTALDLARKSKPRLLVCAPSNAAVDNIILKIMEDGFIDGKGQRYNPSMIRIGVGQSNAVAAVALGQKIDDILNAHLEENDVGKLDGNMSGYRIELTRISKDIAKLRRRVHAMQHATPWPLSRDWEIRINEESFDDASGAGVYFCNHKTQTTTYEAPPPPEPGETQFSATSMPEYRNYLSRIVKLVETYFSVKTELERCTIIKASLDGGANQTEVRQNLETHLLNNSVHMVMTTLGTAGNRILAAADRFEVVVVDEAAQSVEPATLAAFSLGSRHAVLVGDPQQLPATVFNVSGRNSKYDRSLFQRMEEAGQPVYMLNEQYRMHPKISHFPRHIFYGGTLKDGPNVTQSDYGNPLHGVLQRNLPKFAPFMILDLNSKEERGGTSLSNSAEAQLAVYLYMRLKQTSRGLSSAKKVAVITPYAQQARLLREYFGDALGAADYEKFIEVNTVDAFQGREANIVIFSAVRAAGSHGIGFLSDVRRMNVALTRAKHFLFVIARCESIVVNPYWNDLVTHARDTNAVLRVPIFGRGRGMSFGELHEWERVPPTNGRTSGALAIEQESSDNSIRPSDPRKGGKSSNSTKHANDANDSRNARPASTSPRLDPRKPPARTTSASRRADPRKK